MFDRIDIRIQRLTEPEAPIDLGFLAEAMLFYGQVELVANRPMIIQLIRSCGAETLIELLERGYLKLYYRKNAGAIQTSNSGTPHERHQPVVIQVSRRALEDFVPEEVVTQVGRSGKGRRLARRLTSLVQGKDLQVSVIDDVLGDFRDKDYLRGAVGDLMGYYVPSYRTAEPLMFEISEEEGGGFRVQTNINFTIANTLYNLNVPSTHSSLTPSYILSLLFFSREALAGAADANAELATDPAHSRVLARLLERLIRMRTRSEQEIEAFSDFVFDDARAIREAVNSGERTFRDMIELLERADKFKDWLKGHTADAKLVKEYFRAATSSTWVDRLPAKGVRWGLFTATGLLIDALGAGGIGTAIGVGLGAGDTFLLDHLIKGWKPNQFVEGPLTKFTSFKASSVK